MSDFPKKQVLVLGAGFCAFSLVKYLSDHGFHVTVASRTVARAQRIASEVGGDVSAVQFDVETPDYVSKLEELIKDHDVAISMLPYIHHVKCAEVAIKHRKHFATTSYVSDAMRKLDSAAKDAGVALINEAGVDPGTDHMSAMRIIDDVHSRGGKIRYFTSYCGGLPAPEANNNPFGYKLSWAPRGVLLAGRNTAVFLQDSKETTIPGEVLFDNFTLLRVRGVGEFECYPNRDSTQYASVYGLQGEVQTLIRGTLRYPGWCQTIKKLVELGMVEVTEDPTVAGVTYPALLRRINSFPSELSMPDAVAAKLGFASDHPVLERLQWLGLFDESNVVPAHVKTTLDALCHLCEERMQYAPGEKDCIVMVHTFHAEYSDGRKEEITATMYNAGLQPEGPSAMNRTVGFPVAILVRMLLEGRILQRGIIVPLTPDLYNPVLDEQERLGITFVEERRDLGMPL